MGSVALLLVLISLCWTIRFYGNMITERESLPLQRYMQSFL